MPIIFDNDNILFAIQTKNTSYIFNIYKEKPKYEGATARSTLRSLYFGKKVERIYDFVRPFNWLINGYNDGGKQAHERFACEFVGAGGLFYSEPTLKVQFSDGVRDLLDPKL